MIVLPTMVAEDLEPFWSVTALGSFFRTAFSAPLRSHHIALVKNLLFLFGEKESLFALNASVLDVRHMIFSPIGEQKGRCR